MDMLHLRDLVKCRGRLQKAFFPCRVAESLVYIRVFLMLVVLSSPQNHLQTFLRIYRICAVNMDRLSGQRFQQIIVPLRVGSFLVCRISEDFRDGIHSFFVRALGRDSIPVPGLALPGKRPHQIFFCHTL